MIIKKINGKMLTILKPNMVSEKRTRDEKSSPLKERSGNSLPAFVANKLSTSFVLNSFWRRSEGVVSVLRSKMITAVAKKGYCLICPSSADEYDPQYIFYTQMVGSVCFQIVWSKQTLNFQRGFQESNFRQHSQSTKTYIY